MQAKQKPRRLRRGFCSYDSKERIFYLARLYLCFSGFLNSFLDCQNKKLLLGANIAPNSSFLFLY